MILDGEAGQIGVVAQIQFFQQTESIGIHRFDADMIRFCDFTIGMPHCQASENL